MREWKSDEYKDMRKPKLSKKTYSINQPSSMCPLSEAVGKVPLPLWLEIVGTNWSLDDNEGAMWELGVVGGWQKTRAVASLKTIMRVVASIELLHSWELVALHGQVALRSVHRELWLLSNRANLSPKTSMPFPRALPNWQWVVPTQHL